MSAHPGVSFVWLICFHFPNLQEIVLLVILILGAAGIIYMFFALELSHYLASMFKSRSAL